MFNIITSKENPQFRSLLRIAQGKDKTQVLLEGEHLLLAWYEHRGLADMIVLSESQRMVYQKKYPMILEAHQVVLSLSDHLFKRLSQVQSPQGVMALIKVPFIKYKPTKIMNNALLLDRIQDPGNLGTLLRTAAAAGIQSVFLSEGCVNAWADKVLRSAQGAHFVLDIHLNQNLSQLIQSSDLPCYATVLVAQAKSLYALTIPENVLWLFGHEGQGIDSDLQKLASEKVFIPQDSCIESLNVASACAIALFEQRRQQLTQV